MPDGIYVRMIVFGHAFKQEWDAENHNAQDILKMIGELKPDVLNRFIDGKQNPDLKVPVADGQPDMSELAFLNAAMKAGAPGCTISPKVHLNKTWSDAYRMEAAQSLRDLAVTPKLTMLDLDCWFAHPKDAEGNRALLQKFRDMGWTRLVTNPGPYKHAYGYESSVMTYMNEKTWLVPKAKIGELHRRGIALPLLHIDYPAEITAFRGLKPDRQAEIINSASAAQRPLGFRFIYPVLYGHYDATRIRTSKDGPYHGATIFEVIRRRIEQDRVDFSKPGPAPTAPEPPASPSTGSLSGASRSSLCSSSE